MHISAMKLKFLGVGWNVDTESVLLTLLNEKIWSPVSSCLVCLFLRQVGAGIGVGWSGEYLQRRRRRRGGGWRGGGGGDRPSSAQPPHSDAHQSPSCCTPVTSHKNWWWQSWKGLKLKVWFWMSWLSPSCCTPVTNNKHKLVMTRLCLLMVDQQTQTYHESSP